MSIDHEPRIQELYSKLTVDYLKECAKNDKINEWNSLYLEYLHLASGLYNDETCPIIDEQQENRSYNGRDTIIDSCLMNRSEFQRPNFYNANLNCLNLEKVILRWADLKYALFSNSRIFDVDFSHADIAFSHFVMVSLDCVNFSKANLQKVIFRELHAQNIFFTEAYLADIEGEKAEISNADFTGAILEKADLEGAIITDSQFKQALLSKAIFHQADLTESKFLYAELLDTIFIEANLTKSNFRFAEVNGGTIFEGIIIDDNTDFTGVGLSNVRIGPKDRVRLEKNIRKKHWEEWYTTHLVLSYPVKLFWWLSDYGTSCKRCLASFVGLILFAFIVNLILTQSMSPDIAELFANTVLALFGVGDPGLEGIARLWQVVYVVSGYFLLAVLISRFAIMFQNTSP
jgi:uncharacterized protein YjbI with pentapeptide repeats